MHPAVAVSSSTASGCRLGILFHHVAQLNLYNQKAISLLLTFGVCNTSAESGDQEIGCHKGHN